MGRSNSIPDLKELLKVIKALEDADYWGHSPPPSSRKRSKGYPRPVFDALPGEFGDFDQTYDRPPPPYAKSEAKSKSKSTSRSKSASTSKSASKSMPTSKSKSKDKDKDKLVCES